MSNDKTLNQLWNKQDVQEYSNHYSEIMNRKRKRLAGMFVQNILLLVTIIFLFFVWYYTPLVTVTAKTGITFLIAASISFMIANGRITFLLKRANPGITNKEYLKQLINLKAKQFF